MRGYNTKIFILTCLCFVLSGVVICELTLLKSNEYHSEKIAGIKAEQSVVVEQLTDEISELDTKLSDKETALSELANHKEELINQVTDLNSQIAGLSVDNSSPFPFAVPSTGTVGSKQSTYLDENKGFYHYGVDFWTSTSNGGAISTNRGNPVYSACSGVVESFQVGNGGVTIKCDMIAKSFNVPAYKVYTYYGHMANGVTNEQYIYVKIGQRVHKGQFIGYQGDLSMFTPGMRNVHLHFSVFTGFKEMDGTQDPCKYIGGSCTTVGQFFASEAK